MWHTQISRKRWLFAQVHFYSHHQTARDAEQTVLYPASSKRNLCTFEYLMEKEQRVNIANELCSHLTAISKCLMSAN
jgi:hypothetical protein